MNSQHRPILLIEDNPMDEDLTRRAFVRRKVINPIEVARDGEAALGILRSLEGRQPFAGGDPVGYQLAEGKRSGGPQPV